MSTSKTWEESDTFNPAAVVKDDKIYHYNEKMHFRLDVRDNDRIVGWTL
jgi:hypothetical protein